MILILITHQSYRHINFICKRIDYFVCKNIQTYVYILLNIIYSIVQVSINGRFSTRYATISPFASNIDTFTSGLVSYQTFSTGDPNIESVSTYITSEIGVTFRGVWMLVAHWFDVAENVAIYVSYGC